MIRIRAVKQLAKIALDVDLTLPDRGLTAVFGRSGSGKTTLINILSGLMDRTQARSASTTRFSTTPSAG